MAVLMFSDLLFIGTLLKPSRSTIHFSFQLVTTCLSLSLLEHEIRNSFSKHFSPRRATVLPNAKLYSLSHTLNSIRMHIIFARKLALTAPAHRTTLCWASDSAQRRRVNTMECTCLIFYHLYTELVIFTLMYTGDHRLI